MQILLYVIFVVIWGIVWGTVTNKVIDNKGYSENWFWWGFFFGFFALIVAATKPSITSSSAVSTQSVQTNMDKKTLEAGGWKCSCGRVNPSYTGTCACGKSKLDAPEAVQARKEEEEKKLANLKKVREYKELLDSGVITQEEFEAKKEEILGR